MNTDFLVAGVSALGIVVALVAVLRQRLGWRGRRLVVAALIVGQMLSVGSWAAVHFPQYADLWQAIIAGLVLWLMAMGAWSGSKAALEKPPEVPHG